MKDQSDLLDFYAHVFRGLRDDAERDRERIIELTDNVGKAVSVLNETSRLFDRRCEKAATQGIAEALKKIDENLEAVSQAARLAQANYENVAKYSMFKFTLAAALTVSVTAGVGFFAAQQAVPSKEELMRIMHSGRSVAVCPTERGGVPCAYIVNSTTGKTGWASLAEPPR